NEKHQDPNFPDPAANNANIRAYTEAMREVASAACVQFVDLFDPSLQFFAEAARRGESLTINGLHLSEKGDKLLAEVICKALFGENEPLTPALSLSERGRQKFLERLRQAVNDKNAQWHARYRTVD